MRVDSYSERITESKMADYKYKGVKTLKFNTKKLKRLLKLKIPGTEVAERVGISEATLYRYLNFLKTQSSKITEIDNTEIIDLALLGARARMRLAQRIETMNPIELTAVMDRTFQQRRLLQGKSTANVSVLADIIFEAHKQIKTENLK